MNVRHLVVVFESQRTPGQTEVVVIPTDRVNTIEWGQRAEARAKSIPAERMLKPGDPRRLSKGFANPGGPAKGTWCYEDNQGNWWCENGS